MIHQQDCTGDLGVSDIQRHIMLCTLVEHYLECFVRSWSVPAPQCVLTTNLPHSFLIILSNLIL